MKSQCQLKIGIRTEGSIDRLHLFDIYLRVEIEKLLKDYQDITLYIDKEWELRDNEYQNCYLGPDVTE